MALMVLVGLCDKGSDHVLVGCDSDQSRLHDHVGRVLGGDQERLGRLVSVVALEQAAGELGGKPDRQQALAQLRSAGEQRDCVPRDLAAPQEPGRAGERDVLEGKEEAASSARGLPRSRLVVALRVFGA